MRILSTKGRGARPCLEYSTTHGPKEIAKRRKPEELRGRPLGDFRGTSVIKMTRVPRWS